MKREQTIKAVIFDFGRVISAQKPVSLFRTYENDLGLSPDSINNIMFDSPIWEEACLGSRTVMEYWHAIGPELGLKSREEIDEFRQRYYADESINTGVLNIIRHLHGRYKLAILSNNPPGLDEWLNEWGMLDLFDEIFCSGDEGLAKPDENAYKLLLKWLGVLPSEAVFIDDTAGHVEAARTLGIHGILFTTAPELEYELNQLLAIQIN